MQSVQLEAGYAMEFLENHRLVFLKHGDIYQQNAGYVLSLESKLFLMYTGLARNRIIIYNKVQNINYQIHVEGRYMYQSLGISTLTISNAYIYRYSQNRDVHWSLWYQLFLSASQRSYTCPSAPVSRILYSEVLINFGIVYLCTLCPYSTLENSNPNVLVPRTPDQSK